MNAFAAVFLAAALLSNPRRRRMTAPRRPPGRRPVAMGITVALVAGALLAGPALTVSAVLLGLTVLSRRRRSRSRIETRCEGGTLATALEVLAGELRAGSHPVRGLDVAAGESSGRVAVSMAALAAHARLGADVAAGLRSTAARSSVPQYWARTATCWQLAVDRGLPIALLVQAAYQDITHRQRFIDRIDAGLSGARATAAVLACLPVLGVLFGELVGARPLRFLVGGGGWVLVTGVALQCAGLIWSDRITDRAAS